MADATKVANTEVQAAILGLDLYMVQVELGNTETTAVDLDTGFRSVVHAQATWADADVDAGSLIVTVKSGSPGTLSIESSETVTGTNREAWILAFGYRG
jgi:hypothetical protein